MSISLFVFFSCLFADSVFPPVMVLSFFSLSSQPPFSFYLILTVYLTSNRSHLSSATHNPITLNQLWQSEYLGVFVCFVSKAPLMLLLNLKLMLSCFFAYLRVLDILEDWGSFRQTLVFTESLCVLGAEWNTGNT